ncbi:Rieske (2Fe-2S) protein [Parasphingorhabdus sp.]|uniref:Rieske (2Fe-2S) protein n=1 Tax=Parasphingorhabdus sp. TaxID=2709688 RepID=UPI003A90B692
MNNQDRIEVGKLAELADGESKGFCVRRQPILVCNSGGKIYAVANECSHAFQTLETGRIRAGWIACPAHGTRFDLATGEPLNPPAVEKIETFPVEIEDGRILVDVSGIA